MANPIGQHLPLRVALRFPEFAAAMSGIASRFGRQRMQQQAALQRFTRRCQLQYDFEVFAGLLLGPCGVPCRQRLKAKASFQGGVTVVAARSIFALFQENWLDPGAISFKIERGRLAILALLRSLPGSCVSKRSSANRHSERREHNHGNPGARTE